mgnify:FL=1|tara:strand:+ start:1101 stop:1355 length:255 start_codon:yes stop_codon:yes gene_type:complete
MAALVKLFCWLFLIYYLIKFLSRLLFPLLLKKFMKSMMQRGVNNRYKHKKDNNEEGKVVIEKMKSKKSKSKNIGEYIDFEEIEE